MHWTEEAAEVTLGLDDESMLMRQIAKHSGALPARKGLRQAERASPYVEKTLEHGSVSVQQNHPASFPLSLELSPVPSSLELLLSTGPSDDTEELLDDTEELLTEHCGVILIGPH